MQFFDHIGNKFNPWVRVSHQGSERNLFMNDGLLKRVTSLPTPIPIVTGGRRDPRRINITVGFNWGDFPEDMDVGARQRVSAFVRRRLMGPE